MSKDKKRISFRGLLALALAGILPIGAPIGVAPLVKYAGAAAVWPAVLGYLVVLISAVPVLEYSRLASFSGGYYGLAELGLGLLAGKYTALMNYLYYVVWQAQNALLAGWIFAGIVGSASGGASPFWAWAAAAEGVVLVSYLGAVSPPKAYSERLLFWIMAASAAATAALSLYVVARTPYNSPLYLTPASAPPSSLALATAVVGFWLYVGYGTPLFYSEECEDAGDVWKAVVVGLSISAALYALAAYALVAAVPPGELDELGESPMPYLYAWSRYLPEPILMAYPLLLAPAALAYGGSAGSHARLLWAMARDGLVGGEWLGRLDKRGVPSNAALFNLLASSAVAVAIGLAVFAERGYSASSAELAWLYSSAGATILWYLHHVLPEFGLYGFLRRRPEIAVGTARLVLTSLAAPAAGTAVFAYTFYATLAYKYGELYKAPASAAFAASAFALLFLYYRKRRGGLGKSAINYLLAERGVTKP